MYKRQPLTLAWRVLDSVPLDTVHADADGRLDFEELLATLGDRMGGVRVGDLVVDLAELGRVVLPHDHRPTVEQVLAGLAGLWATWGTRLPGLRGAWLTLVPHWFTPVCEQLGFRLEVLVASASMDNDQGLATWRLVVDERVDGAIRRSTARVLVLTMDLDATLTGGVEAIVSDGVLWTTHRRGNRLRQPTWDIGEALTNDGFEALLAALAEGLG